MRAGVPPRSAPTRILIVEDNELNLKLLNDILEVHGYMTILGGMGAVAIDLARQYHPDLILLDIRLPGITGTELAGHLKADAEMREIPIVAITAFAMPGERTRILESGCDDYMPKPINVREFLELIERYTDATAADTL
jgi:two-component system, cell cycle response regulator DivK